MTESELRVYLRLQTGEFDKALKNQMAQVKRFQTDAAKMPEGWSTMGGGTAKAEVLTFRNWDFGMTKTEADAFVRFGYSRTDPSSTALQLKPNPNNRAAPSRLKWKWIGCMMNCNNKS